MSREFSAASSAGFKVFRLIPYVREMRSILEWIFADTSMDVFMWLKFDDIYAWLLTVRYDKAYRKRSKSIFSGESSQSALWKVLYGWLVFLAMLCVVFGPMLLFSTLNPALSSNPVLGSTITVGISSKFGNTMRYFSLFSSGSYNRGYISNADQDIVKIVRNRFSNLILLDEEYAKAAQIVQTPAYSSTEWSITPPGLEEMQNILLNEDADVLVGVDYKFHRKIGGEGLDISSTTSLSLDWKTSAGKRCALAYRLGANSTLLRKSCRGLSSNQDENSIRIPYPAALRLPSGEGLEAQNAEHSELGIHFERLWKLQ